MLLSHSLPVGAKRSVSQNYIFPSHQLLYHAFKTQHVHVTPRQADLHIMPSEARIQVYDPAGTGQVLAREANLKRRLTRRNVKAWELASRSEKGSPLLCLLLIIRFRKLPGSTARAFFLPSAASACTDTAGFCSFFLPTLTEGKLRENVRKGSQSHQLTHGPG